MKQNRLSTNPMPIHLDVRLVATKWHERNKGHDGGSFLTCEHAQCVLARKTMREHLPTWVSAAVVRKVEEMGQR
jgi:hypothetical protein